MNISDISYEDLQCLLNNGIQPEQYLEQLERYKVGFSHINLHSPATVENGGILRLSAEKEDYYENYYNQNSTTKRILKFVPASGAASRMFKDLYAFSSTYNGVPDTIEKEYPTVKTFIDNIKSFAFYDDLKDVMAKAGMDIEDYLQRADYATIINCLLGNRFLGYGEKPKAVLKFHKYSDAARTAMFEHFTEGRRYAQSRDGNVNLHFTVSAEHSSMFGRETLQIRKYYYSFISNKFHVTYSKQARNTNIVAVDEYNNPIRDENGNIVFRPGGHGALIGNLGVLDDIDIVFIKNIDNVVPDDPKGDGNNISVKYKKILGGVLLEKQKQVFEAELILRGKPSDEDLERIENMMVNSLNIDLSVYAATNLSMSERVAYLLSKIRRPIRVCGMVKNVGEPGGGPFWVQAADGTKSLQIVESAQINRKDSEQNEIFEASTHFNPVDLVCGLRNAKGIKYRLKDFVDYEAGFITKKTVGAQVVKSQELPGLWNGSMANWTTIFVEVPLETFNPVKTVNDLLRKEHFVKQ